MGAGGTALALLPLLISGYLFNLIFYPLRYFNERAEGQKLFFMAAGSGLLLGALTFLLAAAAASLPGFDTSAPAFVLARVDAAIPLAHASRLLATIAVAAAGASLLNGLLWVHVRFFRHRRRGGRGRTTAKHVYLAMTAKYGNALAQLLCRAAATQKLVMISLKSRKVYCGRVLEAPTDTGHADVFIELLPSFSAYRDKDTLRLGADERTEYPVITLWVTQQRLKSVRDERAILVRDHESQGRRDPDGLFADATARLDAEIRELEQAIAEFGIGPISPEDWIKAIPVKEIESASFYDPPAYHAWFTAPPTAAPADGGAPVVPAPPAVPPRC